VLLLGAAAGRADGSISIGQLDPGTPAASCTGGSSLVQSAVAGTGSYVVPAGHWVIVSWSHRANTVAGRQMGLRLWRSTSSASAYTLVAAGALRVLNAGGINTTYERIPVSGGELLGIRLGNGGSSCTFTAGTGNTVRHAVLTEPPPGSNVTLGSSYSQRRLNVTARLEADADADGYGDETQDACPGSTGPSNGCPYPAPPPADTTRPTLKLRVRRDSIRDGHVGLWVTPSEAVRVTARGSVRIARRKRAHRLRPATANGAAKKSVRMSLRMGKRTKRAARRALRRGKRLRARITVTVRDAAGNTASAKAVVRLKL
jgi:hypothetical protein